ncbi:menaquinone biosynthesis decarboxylase [Vulcanibacillus modesticaldus]|uniref:Menaquinone biosynthesis decarboxylase n=1 Tax=Vulcanibacillus modesticaldus TaxID=337097 RepID=A0A1D2YSI6_9BACI|nr:menaquinone biosynthesis decarboxylase [Vulcanibacillus modesticaldus]OEF97295.1 menaquinone biosynthesis decarboxylase [Vulcanibacillus modesticaldus]
MGYRDLRDYIEVLDSKGLLKRIKTEVDPELEIAEITDRVSKMPGGGYALLFENVKGSDIPVLTNAMGSMERIKLALEVEDLDDIGQRIMEFLQTPSPTSLLAKIKALPKLAEINNFIPKIVKNGKCQEVVVTDNPSLDMFPILKTWPFDGGKFITMPLVFTKDPETGTRNCGMYRMHVYDGQTTGMHWHKHKDGQLHQHKLKKKNGSKIMEVAVAIGSDPAVMYSATAPLPPEIDEMMFAGFLRNSPVELVKCKTVDLEVPANAEIVLEGYVDIDELKMEGPFGDHTGYYSLADLYPVFHITAITHRKDPIYISTLVGKPPQEDLYLGKATERIFLQLLKVMLPEIKDMNMPAEGVFHNCVIVSIKKRYPFHAKKVMNALWGLGLMMLSKLIIVVDEDVDVQNLSEVAWKVFNNIDPKRDVTIVEGPLDDLDHSSPMPFIGSKMGIDATKKWKSEGHNREWPDDVEMSEEIKELVDRKWKEYGIE